MRDLARREFLKLGALASALAASRPLRAFGAADRWHPTRAEPQEVVVLGAGMAGLSAALELTKLGHRVRVLEGQMRPGGRVFTARSAFADGLYADMGAARIPENHDWSMKYIREFGLELTPFQPADLDCLHMVAGKRLRYRAGQPPDLSEYPVGLSREEVALGWNGIATAPFRKLLDRIGDPTRPDWPPEPLREYDRFSFKEFIERQGYSRSIGDLLMLGWEESSGLDVSVLLMMRELVLSFGAPRNKIVGGNDLLPRRIAEKLSDIIQYGARVLDLHQDRSGVTVTVSRGAERTKLRADRVICTFPPTVLKEMDFARTLSGPKQRAIREIDFWSVSRAVLQVDDRYWRRHGLNGFAATDRPMEIWDPLHESDRKRGLIAAFIKKTDARTFDKLDEEGRIRFAAREVDAVFPGLGDHLEGGFTKSWGDDPWARGVVAMPGRNELTELYPHLGSPEGRIHFAGDHTSAYNGWIQGAIESGHRAAGEVNSSG